MIGTQQAHWFLSCAGTAKSSSCNRDQWPSVTKYLLSPAVPSCPALCLASIVRRAGAPSGTVSSPSHCKRCFRCTCCTHSQPQCKLRAPPSVSKATQVVLGASGQGREEFRWQVCLVAEPLGTCLPGGAPAPSPTAFGRRKGGGGSNQYPASLFLRPERLRAVWVTCVDAFAFTAELC